MFFETFSFRGNFFVKDSFKSGGRKVDIFFLECIVALHICQLLYICIIIVYVTKIMILSIGIH